MQCCVAQIAATLITGTDVHHHGDPPEVGVWTFPANCSTSKGFARGTTFINKEI